MPPAFRGRLHLSGRSISHQLAPSGFVGGNGPHDLAGMGLPALVELPS
jgi:hypothetical protein